MLLKDFEISNVNYWCSYTIPIEDGVYDIIRINYTTMNIDLLFKFKRYKSLCFYELFLDYGETYTPDLEYIELRKQLQLVIPYLELDKDIKEIEI